jgi:hypothetical protein
MSARSRCSSLSSMMRRAFKSSQAARSSARVAWRAGSVPSRSATTRVTNVLTAATDSGPLFALSPSKM